MKLTARFILLVTFSGCDFSTSRAFESCLLTPVSSLLTNKVTILQHFVQKLVTQII
jgi:hypothetical protein